MLASLDPHIRRQIALVAAMIFAYRAVPMIGDGYRWFAMDRLGFDEAFFGVLQLTSTGLGLAAMWLLADALVRRRPSTVLVWLTLMTGVLFLPSLLLVNGAHEWTERTLGLGARSIALIDEAAQSPLFLLATVPLLALIAVHAPRDQRATWFALTASLMSLAVVASQLATKYREPAVPGGPRRLRPAAHAGADGDGQRRRRDSTRRHSDFAPTRVGWVKRSADPTPTR